MRTEPDRNGHGVALETAQPSLCKGSGCNDGHIVEKYSGFLVVSQGSPYFIPTVSGILISGEICDTR